MSQVCITHGLRDFKPCVIRDEHLSSCYDCECAGCLPRPARFGMLCPRCFGRVERSLATHWEFLTALSGVDVAVKREGRGGSHAGPRVPLSGIALDRDELWSMLEDLPQDGDALRWASTIPGAAAALRFAKRMEQVAAAHPWEEQVHDVRIARCPRCAQKTLRWRPPASRLAPVTVTCADEECGYELSQDRFEALADMEERARRGRPPLGALEAWCVAFRSDADRGRGEWPTVDEVEAEFGVDVWVEAA